MENFIRCLTEYLVPEIGSERWQLMWNILNLLCGIASTATMYSLFRHWSNKKQPSGQQLALPGRQIGWGIAAVLSLYVMGLASEFLQSPDPKFPLYGLLYPIADFLDQFLNLRGLYNAPIECLPLANMGIRVVWVYVVFYAAKGIFGAAQGLATHFGSYLDEKFRSSKIEDFAKKVWDFLKKTGLLGAAGLGTAVVVTKEDYRDKVLETLNWLYATLSQITLLSHLPENAASIPEMAEAFFVVILSILIVASYLLLIVAVSAVARILWDKRETILKYIIKWFKEVGYILLILALVLFVVLFSVLFATENASFQEAIALFIQNSPQTIFVLIQHTVMILAALGVVVLMCTALIAVVMFGINLVTAWGQNIKVDKLDANSAYIFLKRFATMFLVSLAVLFFIFGYDPIRGWLIDRFINDGGHGLWWVVWQICSGIAAIFALFVVVALATYGVSVIWRGVSSLSWRKNAMPPRQKQSIPLGQQIEEYLLSLGKNIFQIFKGYQTEDQKNGAIYVAACFASLASLVNTAVGLHDFNIGWILAIAMSFAVQLAMLIFGMKAGQGIAENIVSDVRQVGANVMLAIVRKLASGVCYVLAFFAVQYGISILAGETVLSLSLDLLSQEETFLPALLIWIAALVFFYGVLKQGLDVISLLCRWWKGRKNRKSGDDLEDGLILGNPRRIPARYPLMAYLLFMLVSTTFAFTNLFGGYANQVQLHTRVYDQVYSETEKKLGLQEKALDILEKFDEKSNAAMTILQTEITNVLDQHEKNLNYVKDVYYNPTKYELTTHAAGEKKAFYEADTVDLVSFCEILEGTLTRDYDSFGEDMTITVYEYAHYMNPKDNNGNEQPNRVDILYTTKALKVTFGDSGAGEIVVGRINENPMKPDHRKNDIDSDNYEVTEVVWEVPHATKYTLLNELLSMFRSYQETVDACQPQTGEENDQNQNQQGNENGGNNPEEKAPSEQDATLFELLSELEILDDVRRNIAELYFAAYPNVEPYVSMIDLPRVIDLYLMQEKAVQLEPSEPAQTIAPMETTTTEGTGESAEGGESDGSDDPNGVGESDGTDGTGEPTETTAPTEPPEDKEQEHSEEKYDKLVEYQNLSDYVDRCIQIYNILNVAEGVLPAENPVGGNENSNTEDGQDEDPVYSVRTYRSYARGVASSNLQISFDALFEGKMELNGTGNVINALYSAQMVAVFILIICALVDFMAFFSGLLLFQDIFLLDMKGKSKLSKLGYIAFDAILTKYLMPPERIGDHRKRKIALIYYLLYCEYPKHKNNAINKSYVDRVLLDRLDVDPDAFMVLLYRTLEYLESNSVSIDTPEFHGWLDSFVKKNGIEFDEVLK